MAPSDKGRKKATKQTTVSFSHFALNRVMWPPELATLTLCWTGRCWKVETFSVYHKTPVLMETSHILHTVAVTHHIIYFLTAWITHLTCNCRLTSFIIDIFIFYIITFKKCFPMIVFVWFCGKIIYLLCLLCNSLCYLYFNYYKLLFLMF